jgi:beta-glucosidase
VALNYTSFSYSNISLSKASFKPTEKIQASVIITNTGKYGGEETSRMYIRDMVSEATRPRVIIILISVYFF